MVNENRMFAPLPIALSKGKIDSKKSAVAWKKLFI